MNITHLPIALTSFIGREKEIADLQRLLDTARLLTLTGAGGCGKTRLALRAAGQRVERAPDGVFWVELAPVSDPALIPQVVAAALTLSTPGPDGLAGTLRAKSLLIVLDNCEHVLRACADLARDVLRAPGVRILATSREPLGLEGETVYPVAPLSVPPANAASADLRSFDAVRLFVERAGSLLPGFALTAENGGVIARICRRLDGIPLAVELASARVTLLSLEQIESRLDHRFALLTAVAQSSAPHHQTLRAAIDWSHSLLTAPEQILLRRLAIFPGGCALEAMEAVCADEMLARESILNLLAALINKSLVVAETQTLNQARYHMLETIREYALEKLSEAGETALLRDRFLAHYAALAEETAPKLHGPYQKLWLGWMDREQDNFRTAMEWSLANGQINLGLRTACGLDAYWPPRGYFQEGLKWTRLLLARAPEDAPSLHLLGVLKTAGQCAGLMGLMEESFDYASRAAALARKMGAEGRPILAEALLGLGSVCRVRGDFDAALEYEAQSEQLYREMGDLHGLEFILHMRSVTAFTMGEFNAARAYLEEGLAIARSISDPFYTAQLSNTLGDLERGAQAYTRARAAYETSLALFRELGTQPDVASTLHNLAYTHLHTGNLDRAQELIRESLKIQREIDNQNGIAECLRVYAALACQRGLMPAAARLYAAADALSSMPPAQWPAEAIEHAYFTSRIRARLSEDEWQAAQTEGRSWSLESALAAALAVPTEDEKPCSPPQSGLSARELEIVNLLAEGQSNHEIAQHFVLSQRTVEKHVANILAKLNLNNRTQVARWAAENQLVHFDP